MNDIPKMLSQSHCSTELHDRRVAPKEHLWREIATILLVMALCVLPKITGAPHRIAMLEKLWDFVRGKPGVVIQTGAEINDWSRAQRAATV